jgi:excisionase family DNA binding protein
MESAASPAAEPSADYQSGIFRSPEPSTTSDSGTFQSGMSIDQAAAVLKISPSTVRRWVKDGQLRSERVTTPQGHAFRVYLDRQVPPLEGSTLPAGETLSAPSDREEEIPFVEPSAPPSMERAEAMVKYNEALIAPLVAELAETRLRLFAQADRVAELARENGTLAERLVHVERERDGLTAELAAERAAKSALEARTAADSGDAAQESVLSRWRLWTPWVLAALAICAAAAVLLFMLLPLKGAL